MRDGDLVPFEYLGRARQLRTKCALGWAAAEPEMTKLLAPLRPRPGFAPMPTHRYLRGVARAWRRLPSAGRLRLRLGSEPGVLQITELRLLPMRITAAGWDEPALGVGLFTVSMLPPTMRECRVVLASVGIHALGRRFQRGARDDKSVLGDLVALGRDVIGGGNDDITVATADGGCWVCRRCPNNGLIVRSFLAEHQAAAA
jgi:hypothetical protein